MPAALWSQSKPESEPFSELHMTQDTTSTPSLSPHHRKLMALIDKLAAVHVELLPMCDCEKLAVVGKPDEVISSACAILQGAIGELREIIFTVDAVAEPNRDGRSE
jgi:hypothetical protein